MSAEFKLRRWQSAALAAWAPGRSGTVEVATGGGKTIFAIACWQDLLKSTPDAPLVVVVPTRALADQWFISATDEARVNESDVVILGSRAKRSDLRRFNISIINSCRNIDPEIWPANRFLVVDECHRAGSPENSKALRGPANATLGLSATPERQFDEGFTEYVEPVLGTVIFQYSVTEALADGVLSKFELKNIRVPFTQPEQDEFDRLTKRIAQASARLHSGGEDSSEHLESLLRARARVSNDAAYRIPTAVRLVEAQRGARTLVFHESIKEAEQIAGLLKERGHSVATYHSQLGANIRRENLLMFKKGIFDFLVTCRALDEGANIPETSLAVIASSTSSTRQRIQRLGRVLRPSPGKEAATVCTIYASPQEEERLRDEAIRLEGVTKITWGEVGNLS